jgi:hypothetical protein
MWEDGSVAFEHALGKVHTECDASRVRAKAVKQDFFIQMHASSSMFKQLISLNRTLEARGTSDPPLHVGDELRGARMSYPVLR